VSRYPRLFAGWLVGAFISLAVILLKYNADLHKISHRCSVAEPNFAVNFLDVSIKVQGQNCRTENIHVVSPWFNIMTKLAIRHNIGLIGLKVKKFGM